MCGTYLLIRKTTEGIPMEIWVWLCPILIIVCLIVAVNSDHKPVYHGKSGRQMRSSWATPEQRARKRRQYARRKMEAALTDEEYEFYNYKYQNAWVEEEYDGRTFKQYKSGMTIEEWNFIKDMRMMGKNSIHYDKIYEIATDTIKEQLGDDKFKTLCNALMENPDIKLKFDIKMSDDADSSVRLKYFKKAFSELIKHWRVAFTSKYEKTTI